jgi:C-terminal processing protease CtpA/Prc
MDVMPDSPADKGGFKPGDIVMAVENNFSKNIQAYKNLMQTAGAKLRVLVMREEGPVILSLKVKNVLRGR